jgi:hypothetical protein
MSIANDLRQRRKGQLTTLQENRKKIDFQATDALAAILMKADTLTEIAKLDTAAILRNAKDLDICVRELKKLDEQITAINEELYG